MGPSDGDHAWPWCMTLLGPACDGLCDWSYLGPGPCLPETDWGTRYHGRSNTWPPVIVDAMQELYDMLGDGSRGCSELMALLEDHVRAASWQELMQPLLPQLPEEALLRCCTHALPVEAPGAKRLHPQAPCGSPRKNGMHTGLVSA